MTDDEVDLIYDYLHANYEYRHGELVNTKSNKVLQGSFNGNSKKIAFNTTIRLNNSRYDMSYAHLVWLYHNKCKANYLAHKDSNPTNNKIENLKLINHSQMMNQCDLTVKNKHGLKGVVQDSKRFGARIWLGKIYKYVSWHDTPEEAHAAYLKAKEEHKNPPAPNQA